MFIYRENYGKNEDCHTILYMTLKQFVSALPKPQKERYLEHCCILVIFFTHDILKYHKYLKFDTISLCLIVFSYFWLLIPQEAYEMDDLVSFFIIIIIFLTFLSIEIQKISNT